MGYLEIQEVVVTKRICTHPQVVKYWEYGGFAPTPTGGTSFHSASLILKDGTRHDFDIKVENAAIYKDSDLVDKVECFLNTLAE